MSIYRLEEILFKFIYWLFNKCYYDWNFQIMIKDVYNMVSEIWFQHYNRTVCYEGTVMCDPLYIDNICSMIATPIAIIILYTLVYRHCNL